MIANPSLLTRTRPSSNAQSYTRSSQDVLGSRQAVESHLLSLLSRSRCPVVDRTNVTVDQRSNWLRLASDWQKGQQVRTAAAAAAPENSEVKALQMEVEVDAIYFQTGVEECARRLKGRVEHETIHSPEQALRWVHVRPEYDGTRFPSVRSPPLPSSFSVLNAFSSQLRPPTVAEGFHKVLVLTPSDFTSAEPSEEEVQRVLQRLAETPASYEGGTRGALMGDARRPGPRAPWRGDGRGRPYGWGALDRGRGARGGPARGRGGSGAWRGERGGSGVWRGDRGGNAAWRGGEGRQGQQTLPAAWGALPPAGAGLPPRPS